MLNKNIKFLLIQIDEAHSTAWPLGVENTPEPQKTFEERVLRANSFFNVDKPLDPFVIKVDGWDNRFAEMFRAWPDKYYLVDTNFKVLAKSEYGVKKDALINTDCTALVCELLQK